MGRLDFETYNRGLVQSRSRGAELIQKGNVKLNGSICTKPSQNVSENDTIDIENSIPYVSRAGLKLAFALQAFNVSCDKCKVLDIGSSTGGFTQCLLRHGANEVLSVDVGRGQMSPLVSADPRVKLYEGINARHISPQLFGFIADMAVMDVSFISQTLIYEALFSCVLKDGVIITLIKPQFEAGKEHLNKNGIVKHKNAHVDVLQKISNSVAAHGRLVTKLVQSPIMGGDGNIEYLALIESSGMPVVNFSSIII